ncbi:MAG: hypothetical protein H0X39_19455 [Actinobacteria bacterium]|nr:hypothetical protein [Actinomycetota bacterium]
MALALLATGCGTQAHDDAVTQAMAWAGLHGETGRISCSSGFKPPGITAASKDFICLVHHSAARCDELYVKRTAGRWRVTLRRRGVDCVQPL